MNAAAARKFAQARVQMVLFQPFFGTLALQMLDVRENDAIPTMRTDGRVIEYSPEFVMRMTNDETIAVIVHEVMHCAYGHPWRRGGRDPMRWNVACDLAINPIVRDSGFKLPQGALLRKEYEGKSAEWIYDRLPTMTEQQMAAYAPWGEVSDAGSMGQGDGDQDGDGDGQGGSQGHAEEDWKQAVAQAAAVAKARGDLPGVLERLVGKIVEARVDWRSVLRRFIQAQARADYSWRTPNSRYMARGLYMPGLRSEAMGPIVAIIDTSGSIDDVLLQQFAGEVNAIVDECQPERVTAVYADARVQHTEVFERGETFEARPGKGGGGTDFRPAFQWIAKEGEEPACIVYITDGMGTFPQHGVGNVPTLWALTHDCDVPFGEKVLIE